MHKQQLASLSDAKILETPMVLCDDMITHYSFSEKICPMWSFIQFRTVTDTGGRKVD